MLRQAPRASPVQAKAACVRDFGLVQKLCFAISTRTLTCQTSFHRRGCTTIGRMGRDGSSPDIFMA